MSRRNKQRALDVARSKHRYKPGPQWDLAPDQCAYCGIQGAITEDHVMPVAGMASMLHIKTLQSWIVPACHECNTCFLGSWNPYRHDTINTPRKQFERKRQYVRDRIAQKYLGKNRRPLWTEEELKNKDVRPGEEEDLDHLSRKLAEWIDHSYTHEDILNRLVYDCFAYAYSYGVTYE